MPSCKGARNYWNGIFFWIFSREPWTPGIDSWNGIVGIYLDFYFLICDCGHTWGWRLCAEGVAWSFEFYFGICLWNLIWQRGCVPWQSKPRPLWRASRPKFQRKNEKMSWAQGTGRQLIFLAPPCPHCTLRRCGGCGREQGRCQAAAIPSKKINSRAQVCWGL